MAAADTRQQLQRELELAYQRGQLDETVRTVQARLMEISESIKDIQVSVAELTRASVSTKRFEALEITVTNLERWKWKIVGVVGGAIALAQLVPLAWKLMKGLP